MTDKEKIKAEIERLIKYNNGSPISVCNDLLYFIDSLPEEPVSDDWKVEMNRYLEGNGMFVDADNGKVKRYNGDSVDNRWDYEDIARHFANWQKQQLMKDAVDAFISDDTITKHLRYDPGEFLEAWDKFEVGDKVKLIIIEED